MILCLRSKITNYTQKSESLYLCAKTAYLILFFISNTFALLRFWHIGPLNGLAPHHHPPFLLSSVIYEGGHSHVLWAGGLHFN